MSAIMQTDYHCSVIILVSTKLQILALGISIGSIDFLEKSIRGEEKRRKKVVSNLDLLSYLKYCQFFSQREQVIRIWQLREKIRVILKIQGNLSNLLNICTKEIGKLNMKVMQFLG